MLTEMVLREFLDIIKKQDIALLYFKDKELQCEEYKANEYGLICKQYLDCEVMEIQKEDNCLEIWIRKGE